MSNPLNKQKKIYRVLSLDGGGVRGLIPLRFLQALEEATRKPTHRIFDTIVGTSTGGFVTALLSVPCEPSEGHEEHKGQDEREEERGKIEGYEERKERERREKHENVHAPVLAKDALRIYKEFGPSIFPAKVLGAKHLFLGLVFFVCGAIYLFFHIESLKHVLPEGQRTLTRLFETHHCAGLLATLMLTCIILALTFAGLIVNSMCTAKYSGKAVVKFCNSHFCKDAQLRHAWSNVGICATDIKKRRSFVFNSMRSKINKDCLLHSVPISKIARATSAAPTYFKPEFFPIVTSKKNPDLPIKLTRRDLKDEMTPWDSRSEETVYDRKWIGFEDGGTKMNNPSKAGLKLAQLHLKQKGKNPDDYEIRLLSVGTGTLTGKQEDPTKEFHNCFLHLLQKRFSKKAKECRECDGEEEEEEEKGMILEFLDKMIHHEWTGSILSVIDRRLTGDVFEVLINAHNDHLEVEQEFKENGNPHCYRRQQFKIDQHQLDNMDDCSEKNMNNLVAKAEAMLFEIGENGQKKWSKEFRQCAEFLGLTIYKQPEELNGSESPIYMNRSRNSQGLAYSERPLKISKCMNQPEQCQDSDAEATPLNIGERLKFKKD